jgi:hypothetical protein
MIGGQMSLSAAWCLRCDSFHQEIANMLSWKRLSLIMAVAIGTASGSSEAESLGVGDPPPKLVVKSFDKGEAVNSAFIINGQGKIAWTGHAISMDGPLEKIISGSWDLKTAAEEHLKEVEAEAKMEQAFSKLAVAHRSGDTKKLLAVIDELVAENPVLEQQLGLTKLPALIKNNEQDKALDLAREWAAD